MKNETKNTMKKYLTIMNLSIIISFVTLLFACNGQVKSNKQEEKKTDNIESSFHFKEGIISIFEDSKGEFWFGTVNEGLCRFDGKSYTYFSTSNGLPHNNVRTIQEDRKGNIWLETGAGICYFNGKIFNQTPIDEKWDVYKNRDDFISASTGKWAINTDELWFRLNNNGVMRFYNENLDFLAIPIPKEDTDFYKEDIHLPYSVLKIYRDNKDHIFFGTFNRGVVEFDGKSFLYHNPNNFGVGTIRSIFQDKSGDYWFGSNGGGLYKYDGENYHNFTKEMGLTSSNPGYDESGTLSRVWAIEQDKNGNMWFGTADSGIWFYNGKTMKNYTIKDGLPSNFVETINKDSKGILWFCSGTNSNGILYNFNGEFFKIFNGFEN